MIRLKDIPIGHYYLYIGYDPYYLRWSQDKVMSRNNLLFVSNSLQCLNIDNDLFRYGSKAIRQVMLDHSYHTNFYDLESPVIHCKDICI